MTETRQARAEKKRLEQGWSKTTFRLPPGKKDALEQIARDRGLGVNATIIALIEEAAAT